MKRCLLTTIIFLTVFNAMGQYNQLGQDILGENENDFFGSSLSMNAQGNRIAAFSPFVDGNTSGQVRVFEFSGTSWDLIGNPILGLPSVNGQGAGTVKLNNLGNRFIFGSPLNSANNIDRAGTTRVFELQNGQWMQIGQDLYGLEEEDFFGHSVDINADGNTIIIGAKQPGGINTSGYAKVYILEDNVWVQLHQQLNGNQNNSAYGNAVSIDDSGSRIAILAEGDIFNTAISGYVQVFESQANSWTQLGDNIIGDASEDSLGEIAAIGQDPLDLTPDGKILVFGGIRSSDNVGYVKVVQFEGNSWVSRGATIIENETNISFGETIAINDEGTIIVVGSPFEGGAEEGFTSIYDFSNNTWQKSIPNIIGDAPNDNFGLSTSMNGSGDTIVTSAPFFDGNFNWSGLVRTYRADPSLSINSIDLFKNFTVYPNPAKDNLQLSAKDITVDTVKIFSTKGELIKTIEGFSGTTTVDVSQLSAGVYFLQIAADSKIVTKKFVKE